MKPERTPAVTPKPQRGPSDVAASIAFLVARGDIPPGMWEPLLGRPAADGETAGTVADLIAKRVLDGTLLPAYAERYERLATQAMETQRGCRPRPGSDLMLELLLESCPADISPILKHACITDTLDAYQGPCCQQSPCAHACAALAAPP